MLRRETSADVVVVGGGIMGVAAAWQLGRRGHRVVLCEQYQLDHVQGSSHGRSRIFRLAYDQSDYVRMAREALDSWREVEQELGQDLLTTTGGFDIGSPSTLDPIETAISDGGARAERLSHAEATSRLGDVVIPNHWEALFQEQAGVLRAKRSREGFCDLASKKGVTLCGGVRALSIMPEAGHVDVETDEGVVAADVVVIATGGWGRGLLQPLAIDVPIRVTREHVAYYHVRPEQPMFPFIWHPGDGTPELYGLPNLSPAIAKMGHHLAGPEVRPGRRGSPDPSRVDAITQFVSDRFPGIEPRPVLSETCLYATTPDDDFVLDRIDRVVVGVGFGGHGFKFAPLIGAMLADLAEGNDMPFRDRFSHRRFAASPAYAG